jgi:hypothetical protein
MYWLFHDFCTYGKPRRRFFTTSAPPILGLGLVRRGLDSTLRLFPKAAFPIAHLIYKFFAEKKRKWRARGYTTLK